MIGQREIKLIESLTIEEQIDFLEHSDDISRIVKALQKIHINEYWSKDIHYEKNQDIYNVQPMLDYVNMLREAGLDIEKKGNSQFGYKIIPPERFNPLVRHLNIFRRNYGQL